MISVALKKEQTREDAFAALRVLLKSKQTLHTQSKNTVLSLLGSPNDKLREGAVRLILYALAEDTIHPQELLDILQKLDYSQETDRRKLSSLLLLLGIVTMPEREKKALYSRMLKPDGIAPAAMSSGLTTYRLSNEQVDKIIRILVAIYTQIPNSQARTKTIIRTILVRYGKKTTRILYDAIATKPDQEALPLYRLLVSLGPIALQEYIHSLLTEKNSLARNKGIILALHWYKACSRHFVSKDTQRFCAQKITQLALGSGKYHPIVKDQVDKFLLTADPYVVKATLDYVNANYAHNDLPFFTKYYSSLMKKVMTALLRHNDNPHMIDILRDLCQTVLKYQRFSELFQRHFPCDLRILKLCLQEFYKLSKQDKSETTELLIKLIKQTMVTLITKQDHQGLETLDITIQKLQTQQAKNLFPEQVSTLGKIRKATRFMISFLKTDLHTASQGKRPFSFCLDHLYYLDYLAMLDYYAKGICTNKAVRNALIKSVESFVADPNVAKKDYLKYLGPCIRFLWTLAQHCPDEDKQTVYEKVSSLSCRLIIRSKAQSATTELAQLIEASEVIDPTFLGMLLVNVRSCIFKHSREPLNLRSVSKAIVKHLMQKTPVKDVFEILCVYSEQKFEDEDGRKFGDATFQNELMSCLKKLTPQEFSEVGIAMHKKGHGKAFDAFVNGLGSRIREFSRDKKLLAYLVLLLDPKFSLQSEAKLSLLYTLLTKGEHSHLHARMYDILREELLRPQKDYTNQKAYQSSKNLCSLLLGFVNDPRATDLLRKIISGKIQTALPSLHPMLANVVRCSLLRQGQPIDDLDGYLRFVDKHLVKITEHTMETMQLLLPGLSYMEDQESSKKILQWTSDKIIHWNVKESTFLWHDTQAGSHIYLPIIKGIIAKNLNRYAWNTPDSSAWFLAQLRRVGNWKTEQYKSLLKSIEQASDDKSLARCLAMLKRIKQRVHPYTREIAQHTNLRAMIEQAINKRLRKKLRAHNHDIQFELNMIERFNCREACPLVKQVVEQTNHPWRALALHVLGQLKNKSDYELLRQVLKEPVKEDLLRRIAHQVPADYVDIMVNLALSVADPAVGNVFLALLKQMGVKDGDLKNLSLHRIAAARTLLASGQCPLAEIEKLLSDPCPYVRHYAVEAIGRYRHQELLEACLKLLDDPCPFVKVKVLDVIGNMPSKKTIQILKSKEIDLPESVTFPRDLSISFRSVDLISTLTQGGDTKALAHIVAYSKKKLDQKNKLALKEMQTLRTFLQTLLHRLVQIQSRRLYAGGTWDHLSNVKKKGSLAFYIDKIRLFYRTARSECRWGKAREEQKESSGTYLGPAKPEEYENIQFWLNRWCLTYKELQDKDSENHLGYFALIWYMVRSLEVQSMATVEELFASKLPFLVNKLSRVSISAPIWVEVLSVIMKDILWQQPLPGISKDLLNTIRRDDCKVFQLLVPFGLCPDLPEIDSTTKKKLVSWINKYLEKKSRHLPECYAVLRLLVHYKLQPELDQPLLDSYAKQVLSVLEPALSKGPTAWSSKKLELLLNCLAVVPQTALDRILTPKNVEFIYQQTRASDPTQGLIVLYRISHMSNNSRLQTELTRILKMDFAASSIVEALRTWLSDGTIILSHIELLPLFQELNLVSKKMVTTLYKKAQTTNQKDHLLMSLVAFGDATVFRTVADSLYTRVLKQGTWWRNIVTYVWNMVASNQEAVPEHIRIQFIKSAQCKTMIKDMVAYVKQNPQVLQDTTFLTALDQAIFAVATSSKTGVCIVFNASLTKALGQAQEKQRNLILRCLGNSGDKAVLAVLISKLKQVHGQAPEWLVDPLIELMSVLGDKRMAEERGALGKQIGPEMLPLLKDLKSCLKKSPAHKGLVSVVDEWIKQAQQEKKAQKGHLKPKDKLKQPEKPFKHFLKNIDQLFACGA